MPILPPSADPPYSTPVTSRPSPVAVGLIQKKTATPTAQRGACET